jgi:hypothetical protein
MSWRVPAIVVMIGLTSAAAAAGGYAIGHGTAPTVTDAEHEREAAFDRAFTSAKEAAYRDAYDSGADDGRRAGRSESRSTDQAEGEDAAQASLSEARAASAETASAPSTDPYDYPLDTPPPEPTGTECPPPFSYHMGGCRLARPAQAHECPPGWVPAGVTGACGPGGRP